MSLVLMSMIHYLQMMRPNAPNSAGNKPSKKLIPQEIPKVSMSVTLKGLPSLVFLQFYLQMLMEMSMVHKNTF